MAKALGLTPADGAEIQPRSDLNSKIVAIVRRKGLTHAQVARLARTSRTRVTAIMNRNTKDISTDLLLHRDKKKRLACAFTVIAAVLLLLLFIVRDIVRENLKDLQDSLARAEMQFQIHIDQAEIRRDLLKVQGEELTNLMSTSEPRRVKNPSPSEIKAMSWRNSI